MKSDASPLLLGVAAAALGLALRFNFGQYHPLGILWLGFSLVLTVIAVFGTQLEVVSRLGRRVLPLLPLVVIGLTVLLLGDNPLATVKPALAPLQLATGFGAAGMLVASMGRGRFARWGLTVMILAQISVCLWTLRVAPQPGVDVCIFQRESADALLHGHNPYALTFEDPYAPKSNFYGDGLSKDGRLQFGYPYPPLPLLMVLPAHQLGDFRFAMLAAIVITGVLIATMRPGRMAPLAAGLLLFTPRGLFVLEAGWIEPLVLVLLAALVFAACRYRGSRAGAILLGILAGLFFASKQYLIVVAPALWLLPVVRDRETRRSFVIAMVTAGLAVSLPLVLWDPKAFAWSAAILQFHQPFRPDALSFLVPLERAAQQGSGSFMPPAWISLLVAPMIAWVCSRRLRPCTSSFAATVALTLLVLFAFNKQAFCNYYYLVIGALACAVAAAPVAPAMRDEDAELYDSGTNLRPVA